MVTSSLCSQEQQRKGPWSSEEDSLLTNFIKTNGLVVCWRNLPERAGLLRSGKSCRLRWLNYLRPDVKRGSISSEEEDLIIRLHRLIGNRWSMIAGRLPGRTDNEIKNYWKCHLRKKVENGCKEISQKRVKKVQNFLVGNNATEYPLQLDSNNPAAQTTEFLLAEHPSCQRFGVTKSRLETDFSSRQMPHKTHGSMRIDSRQACEAAGVDRIQEANQAAFPTGNLVRPHLADKAILTSDPPLCRTDANSMLPSDTSEGDMNINWGIPLIEKDSASSSSPTQLETSMGVESNSDTSSWGRNSSTLSSFNEELPMGHRSSDFHSLRESSAGTWTNSVIEYRHVLDRSDCAILDQVQITRRLVESEGEGGRQSYCRGIIHGCEDHDCPSVCKDSYQFASRDCDQVENHFSILYNLHGCQSDEQWRSSWFELDWEHQAGHYNLDDAHHNLLSFHNICHEPLPLH